MRALMSMNVTVKPMREGGSHYPTPEQIAEAFTTLGLRPPSLVTRQGHDGGAPPTTPESALFQKLARVATAIVVDGRSQAQDDVLRWTTTEREGEAPPTFADLAREHLTSHDADDQSVVSLPVLLVTFLTLLVKYPRRQVVRWTQLLRPEDNPVNT